MNQPLMSQLLYVANAKVVVGVKSYEMGYFCLPVSLLTLKLYSSKTSTMGMGECLDKAISMIKADPKKYELSKQGGLNIAMYYNHYAFVYGCLGDDKFISETPVELYKTKKLPVDVDDQPLPFNETWTEYPWISGKVPSMITKANSLPTAKNISVTVTGFMKSIEQKTILLLYPDFPKVKKMAPIEFTITNNGTERFLVGDMLIKSNVKLYATRWLLEESSNVNTCYMYNVSKTNLIDGNIHQVFHAMFETGYGFNIFIEPGKSRNVMMYGLDSDDVVVSNDIKIFPFGELLPNMVLES